VFASFREWLVQFFNPHCEDPVPELPYIDWELLPYSFEIDWFSGCEEGLLKSRRQISEPLDPLK
jgi:hypothetical protein